MRPRRQPGSACGGCDLCCTVLGVEEIGKPDMVACALLRPGGGCRSYAGRPASCRDFACAWLAAREQGLTPPAGLRPDRCGVVLHRPVARDGDNLIAHVDPARPRAWLAGAAMDHIVGFVDAGGTVAVVAAGRHYVVDAEGVHEARVTRLPGAGLNLSKVRRIGRIG